MRFPRQVVVRCMAIAAAAFAGGTATAAQEAIERPPPDTDEVTRAAEPAVVIEEIEDDAAPAPATDAAPKMEEIIVLAPKPGERRLDEDYEDPVRAKLLKDFYRQKEIEEESRWLDSDADTSSSRIKLGYDPRDDYRMRNEMALQDLDWERTKPATLFRIEF